MARDDSEYPTVGEKPKHDRYFIFGSKTNTPTEETIVAKIRDYAYTYDMELGATIALLYITASRVEEIAAYKYKGIAKEDIDLTYPSITIGDITLEEKDGELWMHIISRIEKQFSPKSNMTLQERKEMLENMGKKEMILLIDEANPLYPLAEVIFERIKEFTGGANDANEFNINSQKFKDVKLYKKTTRNLQKRLRKDFNIHPHLLRHWRCKHLVENYGYSTSELVKLIGWTGPAMAMVYTEASDIDIKKKQRKRVTERKNKT